MMKTQEETFTFIQNIVFENYLRCWSNCRCRISSYLKEANIDLFILFSDEITYVHELFNLTLGPKKMMQKQTLEGFFLGGGSP